MNAYYVEIMSNSYKWEPKIEFSAADDRAAFAQACEIATKRPGCIAFSVSHRVGKKLFILPAFKRRYFWLTKLSSLL